ncbi:MAG: hypothetical protein HZA51_02760 [Planctomycetes bacterium]|nr:hypothetical protein [Planctomycetota bacterium]
MVDVDLIIVAGSLALAGFTFLRLLSGARQAAVHHALKEAALVQMQSVAPMRAELPEVSGDQD